MTIASLLLLSIYHDILTTMTALLSWKYAVQGFIYNYHYILSLSIITLI